MQIKQDYVPINKYTRPGLKLKKVKGIVIHYTATPKATAKNERSYFAGTCIKQKRSASAHIFVDESEAIQIMPLNEVAYHAHDQNRCFPDELKPNANLYTIGVEMCTDANNDVTTKTQRNAEEIVAQLCKQFGLNPDTQIYRHKDITDKACPKPFISKYGGSDQRFFDFKKNVKNIMNGNQNNNAKEDGLTMSQAAELQKQIDELKKEFATLTNNNSPADDYAKDALSWAKMAEISSGERPKGFSLREEVITLLYRNYKQYNFMSDESIKKVVELIDEAKPYLENFDWYKEQMKQNKLDNNQLLLIAIIILLKSLKK